MSEFQLFSAQIQWYEIECVVFFQISGSNDSTIYWYKWQLNDSSVWVWVWVDFVMDIQDCQNVNERDAVSMDFLYSICFPSRNLWILLFIIKLLSSTKFQRNVLAKLWNSNYHEIVDSIPLIIHIWLFDVWMMH